MTDTKDTDGKSPATGGRRPLSLKSSSGGTVRQSFSHGRSKAVVVEKKKRRIIGGPGVSTAPSGDTGAAKKPAVKTVDVDAINARKMGLSKAEYLKRKAAVDAAAAAKSGREAAQKAEAVERDRRAEQEQIALERKKHDEAEAIAAVEEAKAQADAPKADAPELEAAQPDAPKKSMRGMSARTGSDTPTPSAKPKATSTSTSKPGRPAAPARSAAETGGRIKKSRGQHESKPTRSAKGEPRRRRGKLTIVSALAGDEERQRSLASVKRARQREKDRRGGEAKEKVMREVIVPESITIADLANRMSERGADVVRYLMKQGTMMKVNELLDADTAQLIVEDFGHTVKRVAESDVEDSFLVLADDDAPEDMKPRAPVIAIMGHVDHGKTSLLDALRSTDVAAGEAGGITQHIGAYQLKLENGSKITVLDTPGHAAFSAMRTRGAAAVDIVILVVAADDGIMPQTIESIKFARAAGTPMIIAINKMDVAGANPKRIETDLLQHEVVVESMSGEVQTVEVSAKKKTGLSDLVDAIALQAEILDLKANPDRAADGLVIESKVAKGRGPVATLLVKRGTLKRKDIVVAGDYWGKAKALVDERNAQLKAAYPSDPIEILGLSGAPAPGEPFVVVESEAKAREITEYRQRKRRQGGDHPEASSMEAMMAKLQEKSISEFPLLIKADVQGSVEAIKSSLEGAGNDEVRARIISSGAGGINESDVLLAKTAGAPIIAFNVRANRQAKDMAEREGVEIRYYSIIYAVIDDVKAVLEGMLDPERKEKFLGYATVLEVFDISKLGNIAGCMVTEGKVERGSGVRLLRDDVVLHEGELSTLKRFKDEVASVVSGTECGMGFKNYHDIRKGDQIECFSVSHVKRTLD
ncbi:MAG: translation initiation factor IF-2 [Robiginitomaculum sp.]